MRTVANCTAWHYWWLKASSTNDNEGLFIQNGGTSSWTDTKRHYVLGNVATFTWFPLVAGLQFEATVHIAAINEWLPRPL